MNKILLIDDSFFTLNCYEQIVSDAGCQAIKAETGEIGIAKFQEEKPNIVLCDLMMPEMDGFEVLESIMKTKISTAFILMTADIQDNTKKKAVKMGAKDVVSKPLTDKLLQEVLAKYGNK
jgi:CheY-like chemotaxis protein